MLKPQDGTPASGPATAVIPVCRVSEKAAIPGPDAVAVEEPLEIRLACDVGGRRVHRGVSVTMRTPGHDAELAVGFLFTEGIVRDRASVAGVRVCGSGHAVRVDLQAGASVDLTRLERHSYTASSCGVCGKTSIAAIRVAAVHRPPPGEPVLDPAVVHRLPEKLRAAQTAFDRTGGLHAAALFEAAGELYGLREDVGRHNAVDKLIGAQLLADKLPLCGTVLLVSGRASFELVQKAAVAGVPVLAAVGAPSSLAVELARELGMTLLGFVRDDRFNVYSGVGRVPDATIFPHTGRAAPQLAELAVRVPTS